MMGNLAIIGRLALVLIFDSGNAGVELTPSAATTVEGFKGLGCYVAANQFMEKHEQLTAYCVDTESGRILGPAEIRNVLASIM